MAPISREERATSGKERIAGKYASAQQEFLDFVLDSYVREGVGELDSEKLVPLMELHYGGTNEGVQMLGGVQQAREVFQGFQKYLYLARD